MTESELNPSDNTGLWKALLATQKEIEHAVKDAKNPHLKNKYATLCSVLDAVKPVANKNGLVISQYVMGVNQAMFPGMTSVVTKVTHAATGYSTEDNQVIPLPKSDPQGLGSAITYARRYGLQAIFGISSEDDDANTASNAKPMPPPKREEPQATSEQVQQLEKKMQSALGFKR